MPSPVFEDEGEKRMELKVKELVEKELNERPFIEKTEKLGIQKKIQMLKDNILRKDKLEEKREPVHEHENCPNCQGHTLHITGDTAKCAGEKCGKEYLLIEKLKDLKFKKEYMCIDCGHTATKEETEKFKKDKTCPLCGKGETFAPVNRILELIKKDIEAKKLVKK